MWHGSRYAGICALKSTLPKTIFFCRNSLCYLRSADFTGYSIAEAFSMVRRILALGLLCGSLAFAQSASAQGLWLGGPGFGGIGFGSPGFSGLGFSPYGFGNFGPYGGGFGSGFSPYGFGNAAYFGGYAPARFAYPAAVRPVYVARPVVYSGISRAYPPRPAVRVPLNRASRRAWRRGW